MRTGSSSSTIWRPVGQAGAGACQRRGIWPSVPMGPRSRSSLTMNRKTSSAAFLKRRPAGSSGRSRYRSEEADRSPGVQTAPRWQSQCADTKIYLWDAATGTRKATLEGSTDGIDTAFHPAGTLLASNGWEGRLRLWDPVLGRPWLSLTGSYGRPIQPGRTDRHFARGQTDHVPGRSGPGIPDVRPCFSRADGLL